MREFEELQKKLSRLDRWLGRSERIVEKELNMAESGLRSLSEKLEADKSRTLSEIQAREDLLKAELDEAGKDFAQKKYKLEKDASFAKDELARLQQDHDKLVQRINHDIQKINQEKLHHQIACERQRGALLDVYRQQRNHLLNTREKLLKRWNQLADELKTTRQRYDSEIKKADEENDGKLNALRSQTEAKKEGWALSLEAMKKNLDALLAEKAGLEKNLVSIQDEKEKELDAAKRELVLSREQLEIDKATIIEKAEEDQRRCEKDVRELSLQVENAEKELQDIIVNQERKKKDAHETFEKEESLLKETLRVEGEKRDLEQKVFEQEKLTREKEVARLKEEFEQKKWHWENQIRTLMMQKSVQEAEFDNERMRSDREARATSRSLEAKRDELRQRLGDLKSKYGAVESNSKKEMELIEQRWNWRKNRLWSMWQERLDTLKKERSVLSEQMDVLMSYYEKEKKGIEEVEKRERKRLEDLQEFVLHADANENSKRKQKEIQIELEKTRIIAQIRECEHLISEWMGRVKMVQDEVLKRTSHMGDQMGFLEKLLKEEERESSLFLQIFQKTLSSLGVLIKSESKEKEAA